MTDARSRYFVPDLSPMDRVELEGQVPRVIFVAESPHVSEITPERRAERRPLCGAAGRAWWRMLSEILEGMANDDVSLVRLTRLCIHYRLAILNAVQRPIDSKIEAKFPDAAPLETVGFDKGPGPAKYTRLKGADAVVLATSDLRRRLRSAKISGAPVVCLGNDAEWFVKQALDEQEYAARVIDKVPHPSAWWRKGGHFERVAHEKLARILKTTVKIKTAQAPSSEAGPLR